MLWAAGAAWYSSPLRPTSIARVAVPRRGSRRARPPRRAGPRPTGTGSRRPGTRVPCCGGRSAPARRRHRSRGAGCARRWSPHASAASIRCRSQPVSAATPNCSAPAAPCSSWATCSRSVSRRSPPTSASSRAAVRSPSRIVSASVETPLLAQRPRPGVQPLVQHLELDSLAAASWVALQPSSGVSAAARARAGARAARAPPAAPASRRRPRSRTRCPSR